MAKKRNTRLIGAFVFGAVALTFASIIAFGGLQFLSPKGRFILFFDGSLSGLNVGAPVTFRGVQVGSVSSIVVDYDIAAQQLHIPVTIEIEGDRFQVVHGERNPGKNLTALIERGLRGQLETVSLVTGQTSINLDFHPDTPVRLVGSDSKLFQIPTIPTTFALLQANVTSVLGKISKLPLEKLTDELLGTIQSANQAMKDADGLVTNLNSQVKPLSDSALGTSEQAKSLLTTTEARLQLRPGEPLQNVNDTLIDARRLLNGVNASWPKIAAGLIRSLQSRSPIPMRC